MIQYDTCRYNMIYNDTIYIYIFTYNYIVFFNALIRMTLETSPSCPPFSNSKFGFWLHRRFWRRWTCFGNLDIARQGHFLHEVGIHVSTCTQLLGLLLCAGTRWRLTVWQSNDIDIDLELGARMMSNMSKPKHRSTGRGADGARRGELEWRSINCMRSDAIQIVRWK